MYRFIRWYNQNRKAFFIIITIIAFIIIFIQVLNSIAKEQREQKINNKINENSSTNQSTTISQTNVSVITGEKISSTDDKINTDMIKQFIDYCNNGEIEKAYNMLSSECKELIYPSIEYFKTNYYEKIFYIDRMYNIENWYKDNLFYTYYITYIEDVLATGNTNSSDNKGDYITIVKTDENYYINISSYVGREYKNTYKTSENVKIQVNWIDMYMDYTILNISVTNNTENVICLDTKEKTDTLYLYDSNSVRYTSFLNEIAEESLKVRKNMTNNIKIKFNKIYNPSRELTGVIFKDIVLNYEEYTAKTNEKVTEAIDIKI